MNDGIQAVRSLPVAVGAVAAAQARRRTESCRAPPAPSRVPAVCLLVVCFAPWSALHAERGRLGSPLPVPQVAGNCYERIVHAADGRIAGRQRIRVRDPTTGPRGVQARIDVVKLEPDSGGDGELQVADRFYFRMIGEISEDAQKEEAALQVIGYVGANSRIALDFLGDAAIYPKRPCTGQSLPPIELDLAARGGVVDLLGGRAEIRITQRSCTPAGNAGAAPHSYFIDGVLRLKMYVLGIPFRKEHYVSRQLVDPERGLVRHVLENRDGGRQELVLVESSACSPPWMLRDHE